MLTLALLVVLLGVTGWTLYQLHALAARVDAVAQTLDTLTKYAVSSEETLIDVHKLLVALDRDWRE